MHSEISEGEGETCGTRASTTTCITCFDDTAFNLPRLGAFATVFGFQASLLGVLNTFSHDLDLIPCGLHSLPICAEKMTTTMGNNIAQSLAFAGIASSFWVSGVYFSSSHLTLPTLYHMPTDTSTRAFTSLYYNGAYTLVPLAVLSASTSAFAAYLDPARRLGYGVAGGLTIATMPWTLVVMMGTNKRLIELGDDATQREKAGASGVEELLRRWTWMNFVRSALAGLGGLVGLLAVGEF